MALALVAVLDAAWPAGEWLEEVGDDDVSLTARGQLYAATIGQFSDEVAEEAVLALTRMTWRDFRGPQNGDVYAELVRTRSAHRLATPALPDYTTRSETEQAAEDEAGRAIVREWRDRQQAPTDERVDQIVRETFAAAVPELTEQELEEARRRALAALEERYGREIAEQERARASEQAREQQVVGREAPGL